ncbi:MAG: DUF2075 domain-containing protein [Deltaproteobacteria bacterium]|nr:DUF2075 domain-containing protein [Deltaproteobacteria bacterium]
MNFETHAGLPGDVSPAWYDASRPDFLEDPSERIAQKLAGRAAAEAFETGPDQFNEWKESVDVLKRPFEQWDSAGEAEERVQLVRHAVADVPDVADVVLEFNFRRRGLRLDCVLLGKGALFVVEFKRTKITAADRDQVMNYAINLLEFHRVTREWTEGGAIVVPVLVLTKGKVAATTEFPDFATPPWAAMLATPLVCSGGTGLREILMRALERRITTTSRSRALWLASSFAPSSSIVDAALSLYGQHDVAAIETHAAPKQAIDENTEEIVNAIDAALAANEHRIIFLSGAPGSGKTLVGLNLAFSRKLGAQTVFVTGNAPLVEVLQVALQASYRLRGRSSAAGVITGYPKKGFKPVVSASTFKIVKAHQFLGKRGQAHGQEDGRVVVFDEAQRTYEMGRTVVGQKLEDHEADLILAAQRKQFPDTSVVVALIGHNQAINRGELGMIAWFDAAERQQWRVSVGDDTFALLPEPARERWRARRTRLQHGHLAQSMRFYRNDAIERWAAAVIDGPAGNAAVIAQSLNAAEATVWLTRDLETARRWAKAQAVGGQRSGLIASGQARRLAAHGLFVDFKPDIATWMLGASGDYRSSNALETVQNQYQVQGLEVDYAIVCWDLDLRRDQDGWVARRVVGSAWQQDSALDIAKNSYRVLLTRARKGMIIFVPPGDLTEVDETRPRLEYNQIADYLLACGARRLERSPAQR